MSSRAEMKTFSCIFPESVLYYKSTCRCDGMVDVVDSKCVASVFPSSGKGVANSLLFWYSDSSFINIPPAYPSCFFGSVRSRVFIKVCRCVGTGRRGGLKILWANPPCGFDSRHRHQSNIIRTRSSLREMGSDYLYSLTSSRKPIFETVSSSDQNQSPEGREKRN